MPAPAKGKKKDESLSELNSDQDLEDVLAAENPNVEATVPKSNDKTLELIESARIVIKTSMDIRRGENVLIVCDPTTSEIGQALHSATTERTERVLLVVSPKADTMVKSHLPLWLISCDSNKLSLLQQSILLPILVLFGKRSEMVRELQQCRV